MNDPPRRGTLRARSQQLPAARAATMRLKILLLGDSSVGKTQWARRARWEAEKEASADGARQRSSPHQAPFTFEFKSEPTIGVDFLSCPVSLRQDGPQSTRVHPNLFDMSGADIHAKVRAEFYTDFQALIFAFDLGAKHTFDHLDSWWAEVAGARQGLGHVIVLGLKADLNKVVDERMVKTWCKSRGATYFECSAKSGAGITKAWAYLIEHAQGEVKPSGMGTGYTASQPSPSPPPQQQQQQRPPSASPSPPPPSGSPNNSSSSGGGGGGATNISDLSAAELRRELTKRGIQPDEQADRAELLSKLREHLGKERAKQQQEASSSASKMERAREEVLEDVARWARGKDLRAMLNDIHGWSAKDESYLQTHASFAPVSLAYKKAVVKIHPDKVSVSLENGLTHLRATEMFKTVNAAYELFKKVNEKRGSGGVDIGQPASSPSHSPTPSSNPTPRTRPPQGGRR